MFTPSWRHYFFRVDSSTINSLCIQLFQIFEISCQNISFPNSPPRIAHSLERYQAILSQQIYALLIHLLLKSDEIQPLLRKELLALGMVLQTVFHKEFSHRPGGLGRFADSNSIPKNQTTIFHPILIVATLKCLLSVVEWLSQRCHLSRMDEVSKCSDSMLDLQMISRFQ